MRRKAFNAARLYAPLAVPGDERSDMLGPMGFVLRVLINAAAIYLAASIVPGLEIRDVLTALGAGLVLGLINAFVRPVLVVLTLPVTILTLGLFLVVLNALCLWLTAQVVTGFEVHGFWPAVLGALLISVVSWILTAFVSDHGRIAVISRRQA
jgi:putative membrane protein